MGHKGYLYQFHQEEYMYSSSFSLLVSTGNFDVFTPHISTLLITKRPPLEFNVIYIIDMIFWVKKDRQAFACR